MNQKKIPERGIVPGIQKVLDKSLLKIALSNLCVSMHCVNYLMLVNNE